MTTPSQDEIKAKLLQSIRNTQAVQGRRGAAQQTELEEQEEELAEAIASEQLVTPIPSLREGTNES